MSSYIVYLEQLADLFAAWQKKYQVFVPQKKDGFYFLEEYKDKMEVCFDYDLLYNPPKTFLFPSREELIEFDLKTYQARPIIKSTPQILFGIHPYDIKALNQLDQIMDMGSLDVNYRTRRDNTIIMGLEPLRVAKEAFWASLDSSRVDFGFDLFWTKIGPGSFLVEVGSKRGEELLFVNGKVDKATPTEREAARRKHEEILYLSKKQNSLKYPWQEVPKVLEKSFDSFLWAEKAKKCLACGSCNLICPTCYCFDVQDEVDDKLNKGKRYRMWDGCMLEGFAKIAGGHNFRSRAYERYRHRYFRKGKYIYDTLGELGCVGCGRCVRACTARIANPLEVFNVLWEALGYEK